MRLENVAQQLSHILESHVDSDIRGWLENKIEPIIADRSTKDLFLTYSLIGTKIPLTKTSKLNFDHSDLGNYLKTQQANSQQIARIYLLIRHIGSR